MAKGLCWLGLQDAAQKQQRANQQPGAWAGGVIASDGKVVTKSVMQERWVKTRNKIRWLAKQAKITDSFTPDTFKDLASDATQAPEVSIHYKTTESLVGFIVYVSLMYSSLAPYLKGIYLTLNSWISGQNEDGWLMAGAKRRIHLGLYEPDRDPPDFFQMVPRFCSDLDVLVKVTAIETLTDLPLQASSDKALYIAGNASGTSFGSC